MLRAHRSEGTELLEHYGVQGLCCSTDDACINRQPLVRKFGFSIFPLSWFKFFIELNSSGNKTSVFSDIEVGILHS